MISKAYLFLCYGRRSEKHISGENGIGTITEMKKLWNSLPSDSKPEWLTMEDIAEYEQEMTMPSGKYNHPDDWGDYRGSKKNNLTI